MTAARRRTVPCLPGRAVGSNRASTPRGRDTRPPRLEARPMDRGARGTRERGRRVPGGRTARSSGPPLRRARCRCRRRSVRGSVCCPTWGRASKRSGRSHLRPDSCDPRGDVCSHRAGLARADSRCNGSVSLRRTCPPSLGPRRTPARSASPRARRRDAPRRLHLDTDGPCPRAWCGIRQPARPIRRSASRLRSRPSSCRPRDLGRTARS